MSKVKIIFSVRRGNNFEVVWSHTFEKGKDEEGTDMNSETISGLITAVHGFGAEVFKEDKNKGVLKYGNNTVCWIASKDLVFFIIAETKEDKKLNEVTTEIFKMLPLKDKIDKGSVWYKLTFLPAVREKIKPLL